MFFLGSGLANAENNPLPRFPVGDPRNCPLTNGVYRFEVLPGGGWDNLRNVHMGAVSVMNYSKCKTSDDGKYLIPDDVILYPIKESKVHVFAEMYDHWHNYSSTTTKSINAEGKFGFGSVSGSFSSEFESVKNRESTMDLARAQPITTPLGAFIKRVNVRALHPVILVGPFSRRTLSRPTTLVVVVMNQSWYIKVAHPIAAILSATDGGFLKAATAIADSPATTPTGVVRRVRYLVIQGFSLVDSTAMC